MAFTEPFAADMTLEDAQALLRTLIDAGHKCPLCTQHAKVYRRKINSTMARTLIKMYRGGAVSDFIHTASLPGDTHEASQLSWWGLIAEEVKARPDGGRAGYWKLTPKGIEFVYNRTTVEKYAHIYDGRLLRHSGDRVDIDQALGARFDYGELMAGV